eukprot:scaffold4510_cov183-Amphora_coffeaeformis.AAC.9
MAAIKMSDERCGMCQYPAQKAFWEWDTVLDTSSPSDEYEYDNETLQSRSLRPENVAIVQQAPRVDLSFIDLLSSSSPRHDASYYAYTGARDEDGNSGYIHDEQHLRRVTATTLSQSSNQQWSVSVQDLREQCAKRDDDEFRMLTEKVQVVHTNNSPKKIFRRYPTQQQQQKPTTILCVLYTMASQHHKLSAVRETWGPKCDGFLVASTQTNVSLDAVEIPHAGNEEYNNIWQKIRSTWAYVYQHYYEKYDWFLLVQDDSYFILENLRLYLESPEIRIASRGGSHEDNDDERQTPLLLGRRFASRGNMDDMFNSAGPGYVLNKAALKLLVTKGIPNLFQQVHTHVHDMYVSRILREKFGVLPYDTQDDAGGERFMILDAAGNSKTSKVRVGGHFPRSGKIKRYGSSPRVIIINVTLIVSQFAVFGRNRSLPSGVMATV